MSKKGSGLDLSGQPFGRWTVAGIGQRRNGNTKYWLCTCKCGVQKEVRSDILINGTSTSCGCFQSEDLSVRQTKSDLSRTSEYRTWWHMMERCHNPEDPSYENYGARGIAVCDRWRLSVNDFVNDVGKKPSPNHSIDRIDNNGNYEPGNTRWADAVTQVRNRRVTVNLTLGGETKSMAEWSEITGIPYYSLKTRRQLGWTDEEILTKPKMKNRHG